MLVFEPLYSINMLFYTAKGTLKGMTMDCRMGRFSWIVLVILRSLQIQGQGEKGKATMKPEMRIIFFEDGRRSHKPRKAGSV